MDWLLILLGWIGLFSPTALGAIGSILGCARAGQAACGAMLDLEGGYGRYIGLSALPSSQMIYGIVVMFALQGAATPTASEGGAPLPMAITAANSPALFALGVLCGIALLTSAIYQGACCASAISVSKRKPEVFGLSVAPAAIVEGFAVFAFIFALVLSGSIPK
jgi:V/A-type H+-transporting ATPase subunit K